MGTWGITAFEDDTAMGFYDEFCNGTQLIEGLTEYIDIVLKRKYDMGELLIEGFTEPVKALVSAEIIAATLGNPCGKFPDDEYHEDMELPKIHLAKIKKDLSNDIKMNTIKAIIKIRETNTIHLNDLWMESDSADEWKDYLNNLIERIK